MIVTVPLIAKIFAFEKKKQILILLWTVTESIPAMSQSENDFYGSGEQALILRKKIKEITWQIKPDVFILTEYIYTIIYIRIRTNIGQFTIGIHGF